MATTTPTGCVSLQKSLEWCEGTSVYAGMRRRVYYISKGQIVKWPTLPRNEKTRQPTSSVYSGDFALKADAKFHYIDIVPERSQHTSDPQGDRPSQTQLNKLTLVYPGVGSEASDACAYLNNNDNVFIWQDMDGNWRVTGCEKWPTKTTVAQDNGQGAAGTAGTTISVEAPDEVASPFYTGVIPAEDGDINGTAA